MRAAVPVAAAAACAALLAPAAVEAKKKPPPPPAAPAAPAVDIPPVVYLVEAVGERGAGFLGVADVARGEATPVLGPLPMGLNPHLAVDAATRRWAFTFHQLASGEPLFLDGQALTEPDGAHAVITGQLDTPGFTALAGDRACHGRRRACFETPLFFTAGGTLLVTRSEGSSWWMWNQRPLVAGAKPAPIVDRSLTRAGQLLVVGTDGKRAAYHGKRSGLYVTGWPAPAAVRKPAKVKAVRSRDRVGAPPLVMSDLAFIGDHIFYFRRRPDDQRGIIAAWDLTRSTEIEVFAFPDPMPVWHHRFLHAPPGDGTPGTVVFQHDVGFERGDVYEASLTTWQVRKIGGDVRELLDISPDGRFVLAAAYAEPDASKRTVFDQDLIVIDVMGGKQVARMRMPGKLPKIHDARFVARAATPAATAPP